MHILAYKTYLTNTHKTVCFINSMLVYIQLFDIGLLRVSLDVLIFIDLFSLEKQGKNIHLVLKPEIFIVSP